MTEIRLSNELTAPDIGQVMTVLKSRELLNRTSGDYPDHRLWLEETEFELLNALDPAARRPDGKTAFLLAINQRPSGVIVYRDGQNPEDRDLHIRNISVIPDARGSELGRFMVAQVAGEALKYQKKRILVDTKIGNKAMQEFLRRCGFEVLRIGNAYPGKQTGEELDVVMVRHLETLAV